MNEDQRQSKIQHINRLIVALDVYHANHYPLDLTDSDYEVIKEGLYKILEEVRE